MERLSRADLMSLEQYSEQRADFRSRVLNHKRNRQVPIGPNATLYFEDRLTMQYQIQEMLRVERIFEIDGIQEELDAYNPLIPDGSNWKATFMLEFPDADQRRVELGRLVGIEDRTWVRVDQHDPVYAVADEDMDRETDDKTSAVHFLRFELTRSMADAAKTGTAISMGIDHPHYDYSVGPISEAVRETLRADLD